MHELPPPALNTTDNLSQKDKHHNPKKIKQTQPTPNTTQIKSHLIIFTLRKRKKKKYCFPFAERVGTPVTKKRHPYLLPLALEADIFPIFPRFSRLFSALQHAGGSQDNATLLRKHGECCKGGIRGRNRRCCSWELNIVIRPLDMQCQFYLLFFWRMNVSLSPFPTFFLPCLPRDVVARGLVIIDALI